MPKIVNSTNVFLDSSTHRSGNNLEFTIQSPGFFNANDGEHLRVTLQSFTMAKNWFNVNSTNDTVWFSLNGNPVLDSFTLYHMDFPNTQLLAAHFGERLQAKLYTLSVPMDAAFNDPPATTDDTDHTTVNNRKLSILSIDKGSLTSLKIYFFKDNSVEGRFHNTYSLFGGRVNKASTSPLIEGLDVEIQADTMQISGFYPMQTDTIPRVYIRSNLMNTNSSNHIHHHAFTNHGNHLLPCDILGMATVHDRWVSLWDLASQGTGFFMDIPYRSLSYLAFRITDSDGRTLPIEDPIQITENGDMWCTMGLRIDTIIDDDDTMRT
jgi:hypothetical protein